MPGPLLLDYARPVAVARLFGQDVTDSTYSLVASHQRASRQLGADVRKALSFVLVLVGVFCLVLAALLRFYAPSKAEKTPLNLNIRQVATGPAKLLNAATGKLEATNL